MYERRLYVIGGKISNKASEKIYVYDFKSNSLRQCDFALSKRKYAFGHAKVSKSVCMLFGGKDESGFLLADIEKVDFRHRRTKVIGRIRSPRHSLIALTLN